MMFRRSALDLVMPEEANDLRINTDCYTFIDTVSLSRSLAIGSTLGGYRRHGYNNFADNSVFRTNLTLCRSDSPEASGTEIVKAMLHHLLNHYDQFGQRLQTPVFAPSSVSFFASRCNTDVQSMILGFTACSVLDGCLKPVQGRSFVPSPHLPLKDRRPLRSTCRVSIRRAGYSL